MKAIVLIVVSLFFYSCASLSYKKEPVSEKELFQKQIYSLIEDSLILNAHVGIYIESLTSGEVLFKQNESKLFLPASNQKLYTSAAALEKLGAEYQFKTEVYSSGQIIDSVLEGNLLIRGMGDPAISGRFYDDDLLSVFNSWSDSLKAKGIKKINGNVIGLDGYFTDDPLGKAWNWDDETYWYSAQTSALSFNDNCIDISLIAGEQIGDSVLMKTNPESEYANINYDVLTVSPDSSSRIKYLRQRAKNIIEIEGRISVGDTLLLSISIEKPALWFVNVLKDVLITNGIAVEGETLSGSMPFNEISHFLNRQFTHYSPPLSELVKVVNQPSHNLYAEQIFKTLGAELRQNGSAEEGSKVVLEWLQSIGVDESQVIIADGSGLSRMNLVAPVATASVLRHMYNSPDFEVFYNSLPTAGVDGSLEGRMKNTAAQGVLKAKTGTLTRVSSLSGYTQDKQGNDYLFVIMANNYSVSNSYIRELQNKIAVLLTSLFSEK